jgi:hypothetical protein
VPFGDFPKSGYPYIDHPFLIGDFPWNKPSSYWVIPHDYGNHHFLYHLISSHTSVYLFAYHISIDGGLYIYKHIYLSIYIYIYVYVYICIYLYSIYIYNKPICPSNPLELSWAGFSPKKDCVTTLIVKTTAINKTILRRSHSFLGGATIIPSPYPLVN